MKRKRKTSTTQTRAADCPAQLEGLSPSSRLWPPMGVLAGIWLLLYHRIIFGTGHFWEDLIHQEFPHRIFARDSILALQFPHWNPFTFSGMPFFAALHTGVLYPFNLLMSILPLEHEPYWYVLQLMIVVHVLFAGICMLLFLRSRKLGAHACLLGAVGYMICGFFVTQIIHSLMLYILVWLPLIVLLLERGMAESKFRFSIVAGLLLGATVFAGHPQITFYEFLFLGVYALYVWAVPCEKNLGALIQPLIMFAIAGGMATVQVLPAMELTGESARTEWTFEMAAEGSLSFRQLIAFIMPKVFGAWTGARTGPAAQIPRFWLQDSLASGYHTYWETCFYTGIAVLLLTGIAFRRVRTDPFVRFCAIWCGASLAVALGNHFFVYWLLYKAVPGFGSFRIPARILFTWNFLLPILAAQTLDRLGKEPYRREQERPLIAAGTFLAVVGVAVGLGMLRGMWAELQQAERAAYAARQGWILALNAALFTLPIVAVMKKWAPPRALGPMLVGALTIDLMIFAWGQHIVDGPGAPRHFAQNARISKALKREAAKEHFRVNARQFHLQENTRIVRQTGLMVMKRNQGMLDKVQLVEGYNPLQLLRRLPPARGPEQFDRLLDQLNVKYFINPDYGRASRELILPNGDRLPRARMYYNWAVLDSDSLVKQRMTRGAFDYRNELLLTTTPSFSPAGDTGAPRNSVTVADYRNNRVELEVETEKSGLLWLSEIWYPAWRATVDGVNAEVHCADYSFRAIEVPAGSHTVELAYASGPFALGAWMSILTVLIAAGALFVLQRRGQHPTS